VARSRIEELFSAHRRKVERICRALLRDRHESEDAAQQTFLSAFRALRNGAEPREAEAWLGTIARNECLRRIRDRMREPLPSLEYELEDGRADVHRQLTSNMNAAHLWREIQGLPDQQRDAIVLREFGGLSYEELAVALGVSGAAVESLLFRARGTLRRRLETTLASLNLAGAASAMAGALARMLAGGVAPIATKAAVVGAGAVVFGGGMFAGGGPLRHPKASPPQTPVSQRVATPPSVTIPPARSPALLPVSRREGSAGEPTNGTFTISEPKDKVERSGEEGGSAGRTDGGGGGGGDESSSGAGVDPTVSSDGGPRSGSDGSSDDGGDSAGTALSITPTVASTPTPTSTSTSGKDGGGGGTTIESRDGGSSGETTVQTSGSETTTTGTTTTTTTSTTDGHDGGSDSSTDGTSTDGHD
jgi:RNA polymerase sigma-70 factor, ECF subfamily